MNRNIGSSDNPQWTPKRKKKQLTFLSTASLKAGLPCYEVVLISITASVYEGDTFICSSVIPPSLEVTVAITRLKWLTADVYC